MAALVDAGLTDAIGVAPGPANGFTLDLIDCFERFGDRIDWAMVILNPLEPWPGELCLAAAEAHDVRVITRVVDYGGLFWDDVLVDDAFAEHDHRRFRPAGWVDAGRERLERMRPIGVAAGLTPMQLACQWNLAHAPVACAAPTLIQEAGPEARPIEDKRAELAALPPQRLGVEEVAEVRRDRRQPRLDDAQGRESRARGRGATGPLGAQLAPDRDRPPLGRRPGQRPAPHRPRLSPLERFAAWILTGPVGRVVAFFADLAVYWWRWARRREAGRGTR